MDKDSAGKGPGPVVRGLPVPAPDDQESSSAPSIPSFASLRDTRRRSPIDLLVFPQDAVAEPAPAPPRAAPAAPRPAPAPPLVAPAPPRATAGTRPPEWADLWHLGLRLARWCVRQPLTTARRLLG